MSSDGQTFNPPQRRYCTCRNASSEPIGKDSFVCVTVHLAKLYLKSGKIVPRVDYRELRRRLEMEEVSVAWETQSRSSLQTRGSGSYCLRQWPERGQAKHSCWAIDGEEDFVHGSAGGYEAQSAHAEVLSATIGQRQTKESGNRCRDAQTPNNAKCHGQTKSKMARANTRSQVLI